MSEAPRHWRLKKQRYGLWGEKCGNGDCRDPYIFPPRDICPCCGERTHSKKDEYRFSGKGEVYSYTTVYEAPPGYEQSAPYKVALIRLEEGPMVTAQLTDLNGEVEIGMPVEMVTRRLRDNSDEKGLIVYGYKFRPVLERD